jgi:hypothetical protein
MTTPTTPTPDRLTKAPATTTPTVFSHPAPGASTQPGYEGQDAVVITVMAPAPDAAQAAPTGLILMVVPAAQYVEYTYPFPQGGGPETTFVTTPRSDELPTEVAQLLTHAAVQDALAGALASKGVTGGDLDQ